jgi:hypothetical protein
VSNRSPSSWIIKDRSSLFRSSAVYNNALGSLSLMGILITHLTPVSYSISPRKIFLGENKKQIPARMSGIKFI